MPRPALSGYEALSQDTQFSDDEDDDLVISHPGRVVPIRSGPTSQYSGGDGMSYGPGSNVPKQHGRNRRTRSNSSGVDIKAINARLEKWAEEIANKFKISKKDKNLHGDEPLQIVYSVFVAPDGIRYTIDPPPEEDASVGSTHMTKDEFNEIVSSVRRAISKGIEPKLIKQGSSGSYFMRNAEGKVVAVMKPKDEEPYGRLNPKTTKWLHRNLFPCFFGRSCLIPNLSYISEAAACVLDRRLRTFLVPYTDVVYLASKSFHYDFWDRRAYYRRKKPLPLKVGSFQVFLNGFEDANIFLRKHPWPDAYNNGLPAVPRRRNRWVAACAPGMPVQDDEIEETSALGVDDDEPRFAWTEELKQMFREELEKLVILDYIMRNTDRGLDNWMVKVEYEPATPTSTTPGTRLGTPAPDGHNISRGPTPVNDMAAIPGGGMRPKTRACKISIGAIDNSLAFPWKHPDEWRSFPFGWLFLPASLIGQPFSRKTRDHFLPLLTSTKWWSETQSQLRKLFSMDSDFKERMFAKQMAVIKGQAFNVVETLKAGDQGPLELTRRTRMHVWDDEMDVPIAVPLRVPSSDARRSQSFQRDLELGLDEEEMDIGASAASAPVQHAMPNPNLFDISNQPNPTDSDPFSDQLPRHSVESATYSDLGASSPLNTRPKRPQPYNFRSSPLMSRSSVDTTKRSRRPSRGHGRGFSAVGPGLYDEYDDEGDLGFSVAEGLEGSQRKVIVERLETVKAKNPVFSWC